MLRPLAVALSFLLVADICAQTVTEEAYRSILKAQDQRNAESIAIYFANRNLLVRSMAAVAAGSVQDTIHNSPLVSLLADPSTAVRRNAAFALGQMNYVVTPIQRSAISQSLIEAVGREKEESAISALIEALGKVGDEASLSTLVDRSKQFTLYALRSQLALSVGRYAYRQVADDNATALAVDLLVAEEGEHRWMAAYALMRIGDPKMLEPHIDKIAAAAGSEDPEVRMHIVTALGKTRDTSVLPTILERVTSDSDWRVQVNALKALGQFDARASADLLPTILKSADDSNEHVSLTSLSSLGAVKLSNSSLVNMASEMMIRIIADTSDGHTQRQKREAAISLAKLSKHSSLSVLADAFNSGSLTKQSYVEALGHVERTEAFAELLAHASESDPRTRRAALEGLQHLSGRLPLTNSQRSDTKSAFVEALRSDDLAVITTAASALSDSALADTASSRPLVEALRRLRSPADVEPMAAIMQTLGVLKVPAAVPTLMMMLNDSDRTVTIEAANALEKITGRSYKENISPHTRAGYSDYDWETIERLEKRPEVEVLTSRGSFRFALLPHEAPFTCLSFARLVSKEFYDGLTFHRVVPNFVVQGGDPHGDGWGGPGYAIRSEFGFEHYDRGMVGMASAGKDTEGCQFFVTHSRQPHLDGRYTIFGRVISGMDVVDAIQVGDKIVRVRFVEGTTR